MTSTSFNPIQTQQLTNSSNLPLTLKQGQIFHGTIKQVFPDQMAEIQIGNHRMVAKLEVPLKAGDAHFFQVTGTTPHPQPELKVVTGPMGQGTQAQHMQQLLDSMNLPKTVEIQQVLSHFIKQQMPITKEQLVVAERWMKTLSEGITKQDGLQALQRMIEFKMPFTQDVFQALVFGQKTTGMTTTLDSFAQQLLKDNSLSPELKHNLMQSVQNLKNPFDTETGGLLLAKSVQTLTNSDIAISTKLQILNLLKEAGVLPQQVNMQNWATAGLQNHTQGFSDSSIQTAGQVIQAITTANIQNTKQLVEQLGGWIQSQSLLTGEQKEQLQKLVQRFSQLPQTQQTLEVFSKQMHEQLLKAFANNTPNLLFTQEGNSLSTKEHLLSLIRPELVQPHQQEVLYRNIIRAGNESVHPVVQIALSEAESIVQNSVDSKAIEQAMKSVLKGLGVSYEAALTSRAVNTQEIAGQLKPQLLALIQEGQITAPLRESAEMLVSRMNGMQLLSGENGHQHQLIMQVPLEFFGKKMDATLQWNGRMKDDGKIDSSYVRILFYLQMASIQETVIDMQVQNRIVTVTLYNEHTELATMADSLKLALKAGLAEKEYQISGVFIKPFVNSAEPENRKLLNEQHPEDHNGVDIRI